MLRFILEYGLYFLAVYLLMLMYTSGSGEATSWIYWAAAGAGVLLMISALHDLYTIIRDAFVELLEEFHR